MLSLCNPLKIFFLGKEIWPHKGVKVSQGCNPIDIWVYKNTLIR